MQLSTWDFRWHRQFSTLELSSKKGKFPHAAKTHLKCYRLPFQAFTEDFRQLMESALDAEVPKDSDHGVVAGACYSHGNSLSDKFSWQVRGKDSTLVVIARATNDVEFIDHRRGYTGACTGSMVLQRRLAEGSHFCRPDAWRECKSVLHVRA